MIEAAFEEMRKRQVGIGMMHLRRADFIGHEVPAPEPQVQLAVSRYLDWLENGRSGAEPDLPSTLAEPQAAISRLAKLLDRAVLVDQLSEQYVRLGVQLARSLAASNDAHPVVMSDLVKRRPLDVQVRADEQYDFAGVYSFGRGVFKSVSKVGKDFSYEQLCRVHAGDFVYPKLMAWEGALGVVPEDLDGLVVSPEFPVFEVDQTRCLPEVLHLHFTDPATWPGLRGSSTGTNVRRRRLNPNDFLKYQFPLPSMSTQLQLRALLNCLDRAARLSNRLQPTREALIPALISQALSA
jgi:type I restriction enzyme S subunit